MRVHGMLWAKIKHHAIQPKERARGSYVRPDCCFVRASPMRNLKTPVNVRIKVSDGCRPSNAVRGHVGLFEIPQTDTNYGELCGHPNRHHICCFVLTDFPDDTNSVMLC